PKSLLPKISSAHGKPKLDGRPQEKKVHLSSFDGSSPTLSSKDEQSQGNPPERVPVSPLAIPIEKGIPATQTHRAW
ncbi:MAG: hypothetical protein QXI19_12220, partial [Candidatus Caldarchaeum sp.]